MEYPFWDAGIGHGLLMGTIAVLHVFISHFAIGGGLYLVLSETRARRSGDAEHLAFLQDLSRFFVLVSLVMGALTGVAIWFIIGLLNPVATEVLLHNYVWLWATEWTFFVVEITAALIYYYGWGRMQARDHLTVGWIYFASAWLSLFAINGIITAMLTPGRWLETGAVADGFWNPTFWPSLVTRTGICVTLAGLYALAVAGCRPASDLKARLVRGSSLWVMAGLAIAAPGSWWYWRSLPADVVDGLATGLPEVQASTRATVYLAAALLLLPVAGGLALGRRAGLTLGLSGLVLGIACFGQWEWARETIRKPYAIAGYVYGNGILVGEVEELRRDGMLAHLAVPASDSAADLFRHSCGSCHTIDGYRALAPALGGTGVDFIAALVQSCDVMHRRMPPFAGTPEEARLIAAHIHSGLDPRSLPELHAGLRSAPAQLGRIVFEVRCGKCHQLGGRGDISDTLVGKDDDYLREFLLEDSGDVTDEMPAWTGSEEELDAFLAYFAELARETGQ